nr:unnamed protein product [Callosobruchus analis]
MSYSFEEMTDMLLIYGEAKNNGRQAVRLYEQKFPNRRIPHHSTFASIEMRLRETGNLRTKRNNAGRPRTTRTVSIEEAILNNLLERPSLSTRTIGKSINLSNNIVWRVLREQMLHPYKFIQVQALEPQDYPLRLQFCNWFSEKCREDRNFSKCILYTDEAKFTREGIYNYRNSHIWDEENPHCIRQQGFQSKFSVNVWAGIVGDCLIGPYMLPNKLNGTMYTRFLEEVLDGLLEDVPLNIRANLWFQHDGASVHFSRSARNCLTRRFGEKWIGRGGPHLWPVRSPDLNPIDFFLWGYMKSLVYDAIVESEEELIGRIYAAAAIIQSDPTLFCRTRYSMHKRCRQCIQVNGQHFEQLL